VPCATVSVSVSVLFPFFLCRSSACGQYFELAQVLNRSLLIPSWGVAINLRNVID